MHLLTEVKTMLQACIQCGTCSGSCPNGFAMDFTPRRLWRLVAMEQADAIFASQTFMLCSSCYYCTLRCPRGLPLTDAMAALKRIAESSGVRTHRKDLLFYTCFLESVRRHGRVREMEFMTLYFTGRKNPLLPFRFARLGLKLMVRGKVPLQVPTKGSRKLDPLFKKVREMEAQSIQSSNR